MQEMQGRVADTATGGPGVSVKDRLRHAARALRLPFSRIQNIYYGEARRIDAHEADQIRYFHELARVERLGRMKAEYEAHRHELLARAP